MKHVTRHFRSVANLSSSLKVLLLAANISYILIFSTNTVEEANKSSILTYLINIIYSINAGALFFIITVHLPLEKRRDLTMKLLNNQLVEMLISIREPLQCAGNLLTHRGHCTQFNSGCNFLRADFHRILGQIDLYRTPLPKLPSIPSPYHASFLASLQYMMPRVQAALNLVHNYNQSFDEELFARLSSLQDNLINLERGISMGVGPWLKDQYFELWFDATQAYKHLKMRFRRNMANFHYYARIENVIKG